MDYACRKATAVALGNLAGNWVDAAFQMEAVADMHGRLKRRCYHMVLSWGDGENPDDREALAAARGVLREMGWHGHQHVLTVHRDRPNIHVHVVLNRVHPLTGRAFSTSHDYARLERACRVIEREFGWPPDRGRFLPRLIGNELVLLPRPKAHWEARRAARAEGLHPDPRGVRGAERRSGMAPLRDRLSATLIRQARAVIEKATGWAAMHAGLIRLGLRYLRHGSGARIAEVAGGGWMPASHLGSAFGLHRLCTRLGAFQPGAPQGHAALDAADLAMVGARRQHAEDRARRRDQYAELRQRQKMQSTGLGTMLRSLDRRIAAAFRRVLEEDQRAERAEWRSTPLPRLADYGLAPPAPDALPLREQQRRHHRHLWREESVRKAGGRIATGALDHTRVRQLWQQATWRAAATGLETGAMASMLRVGPERLLLPRLDPAGAILGYDLLTEEGDRLIARPISGEDLALGMLGPQDAPRCLVTANAGTATMLSAEYPEFLVIAAAPCLSARTARQLQTVIGQRPLHIVCRDEADADFVAWVMALLPHAIPRDPSEHAVPGPTDNYAVEETSAVSRALRPRDANSSGDAGEPAEARVDDMEPDISPWLST